MLDEHVAAGGETLTVDVGRAQSESAYDSRIPSYKAALGVKFPVTLKPGDSLVSTISHEGSREQIDLIGEKVQLVSVTPFELRAVGARVERRPSRGARRPPGGSLETPRCPQAAWQRTG